MTGIFNVTSERIDDVPLIIQVCKQLGLDELVEKHMKTHGLQQGLNNGKLTIGWLSYIISQSDHRLNSVRDWANKIPLTLSTLLDSSIRDVEFSDDRLCNLLDKFADTTAWESFEANLWKNTVEIYEVPKNVIRFDGTSVCGYHDITEEGLMQFGKSKDHRPDLPQLKIMAASIDPGILIGMDIASGEKNDDSMYLPLIERVHSMMDSPGQLYVGDCKMGAINTRATIQSKNSYYLMPLAMGTEKIRKYFDGLIEDVVNGLQSAEIIYNTSGEYIVAGYEVCRKQKHFLKDKEVTWNERLFVYRSKAFADNEIRIFEKKMQTVKEALYKLTPPLKQGSRQIRDEQKLNELINAIIEKNNMQDIITVKYEMQMDLKKERYVITDIFFDEIKIKNIKAKLGWRLMATNSFPNALSFREAILIYRNEWILENNFKLLKKSYLGMSPLFVRKDNRLKGLCRLLSLALKLIALIQYRIREGLILSNDEIKGLERGKVNSRTNKPTTLSILDKFVREQITISKITIGDNFHYHMTPIDDELKKILSHLKIPLATYEISTYAMM